MFIDLVDSTTLSQRLDPEDLRALLQTYQDACGSEITRVSGYISRYLGDGILAYFGYPIGHEDAPIRAARAALGILKRVSRIAAGDRSFLACRIGIATGVVVAGDVIGEHASEQCAIIGESPNLAARLQNLAAPNTVVVSESTYHLIHNVIPCISLGTHQLKGYSEPIGAFVLEDPFDDVAAQRADRARPASPFVGRRIEFEQLTARWHIAASGAGGSVVIQGDSGIGKSRLVREFRSTLDPEASLCLEIVCSQLHSGSALHPVVELMQRTLGVSESDTVTAVAEKLRESIAVMHLTDRDPEQTDDAAIRALAGLLVHDDTGAGGGVAQPGGHPIEQPFATILDVVLGVADGRSLLLVVEDIHWADPSTRQFLTFLRGECAKHPLLLVGTARPEFDRRELADEDGGYLELGRLTPEGVRTLIDAHAREHPLSESVCELLIARSDGVPLYVEELTRAVVESGLSPDEDLDASGEYFDRVPASLRDSLMARLDRLSNAKQVAQIAAVMGRSFAFPLLHAITGLEEDELREGLQRLVASDILQQSGNPPESTYVFKHALIQDTAYASLLRSKRREHHAHIAHMLETRFSSSARSHPEVVARHYDAANRPGPAAEHYLHASQLAQRRGGDAEALEHAGAGLACADRMPDAGKCEELRLGLLTARAEALRHMRGYSVPEVVRTYRAALRICQRLDRTSDAFWILRGLHSHHLLQGPLSEARQLANQLVDVAERIGCTEKLSEAKRCLGWTLFCAGEMARGRALVSEALELGKAAAQPRQSDYQSVGLNAVALANLAWITWTLGDEQAAVRMGADAIRIARSVHRPFALAYALCMSAAVHQCRGEPDEVLGYVGEAMEVAEKYSFEYWLAWGQSLRGWARASKGEILAGTRDIEDGLHRYKETGSYLFVPHILTMLAEIRLAAMEHDSARTLAREALEVADDREVEFLKAMSHRVLGEALANLGHIPAAHEALQRAINVATAQGAGALVRNARASLTAPGESAGGVPPHPEARAARD
jgi:class 3 adenylate cyclase/tetratricopeptide (TPR) repeat protein